MDTLTCPKCHGSMRVYERSGVTVDQCTECRGIFLDRGELEKMLDAEAAFNASQAAPPPPPQPQYQQPQRYDDRRDYDRGYERRYDDDDDDYRRRQQYPSHHHKKKRKSFLEDLFD